MISLWFFVAILVLIGSFLALLIFEARKGRRLVFVHLRESLDTRVVEVSNVLRSIEYGPAMRAWIRRTTNALLHEFSAAVLFVVRFLERMLTKFVKRMYRVRREDEEDAKGNSSPFIEAIKEVKKEADEHHKHKNGRVT